MRVMVGIDGSDASFYALQWTLDNLFNGLISPAPAVVGGEATLLTLVHVHQPIKHYGFAPSAFPAGPGVLGKSYPWYLPIISSPLSFLGIVMFYHVAASIT